jgi:hypothetical protein
MIVRGFVPLRGMARYRVSFERGKGASSRQRQRDPTPTYAHPSNPGPQAHAPHAATPIHIQDTRTHRFLNPRLGKRRCRGVCPPSKPRGMLTLARFFCPFMPRPLVFPRPDPIPRPTRFRCVVCVVFGLVGWLVGWSVDWVGWRERERERRGGGWERVRDAWTHTAASPPPPQQPPNHQRKQQTRTYRLLGPRVVPQLAQAQEGGHVRCQAPYYRPRHHRRPSLLVLVLLQQGGSGPGPPYYSSTTTSPSSSCCCSSEQAAPAAPHGSLLLLFLFLFLGGGDGGDSCFDERWMMDTRVVGCCLLPSWMKATDGYQLQAPTDRIEAVPQ